MQSPSRTQLSFSHSNFELTCLNTLYYVGRTWMGGRNIQLMSNELNMFAQHYKKRNSLNIIKLCLAPIYNILVDLSGTTEEASSSPLFVQSSSTSIEEVIQEAESMKEGELAGLVVKIYFTASLLLQDFTKASAIFIKYPDVFSVLYGNRMMSARGFGVTFHGGLVCARMARETQEPNNWFQLANKSVNMFAYWTNVNALNFGHCHHLLKAELHNTRGESIAAIQEYKAAAELAQKNDFCRYHALAEELQSLYHQKLGNKEEARESIENAALAYEK